MNAVKIYKDACHKLENNEITIGEFDRMVEPLEDVKENVHGEWIDEYYTCSVCKRSLHEIMDAKSNFAVKFDYDECPFCPWCGADMRSGSFKHNKMIKDKIIKQELELAEKRNELINNVCIKRKSCRGCEYFHEHSITGINNGYVSGSCTAKDTIWRDVYRKEE